MARERPRHGHSLPFARRQLAGIRLAAAGQTESLQRFERMAADAAVRDGRIHEHEGVDQVLERVQARQQPLLLIDEGDLAADSAEAATPPSVQPSPPDPDLASGRSELAVDEAKQGGLAGTARPCDLDELALGDAEIDIGEYGRAPE